MSNDSNNIVDMAVYKQARGIVEALLKAHGHESNLWEIVKIVEGLEQPDSHSRSREEPVKAIQ